MGLLKSIFGDYSSRELKSIYPIVDKIEALGDEYKALTDAELQAKTPEFKERLANGETLDDILPEAFATVREAADRVLGMRPYRVQLVGGIVLHQGRIAEMKTGEGKTLVATLPAYLNALTGKGVHVVTVNDYLAKPFHLAELEARIRSLTLRQFTQQDVLLSCGDLSFDTRSRTAAVNGQTLTLTRKETGILEYLMVHQGRPVSQEELMDHVWDNSVDSFSNSIRVHISALRKKLRAVLGYDPIRNRIGEGYLMGGEEE